MAWRQAGNVASPGDLLGPPEPADDHVEDAAVMSKVLLGVAREKL
ncbi:MAG TPA: hypothetical protein VGN72_18210 [Tepidisphaeraceae bacterium]|jgi:hypothetical protein|nr:hypothetical protein [Tepidisphaeraceae bacterium]